MSNKSVLRDSLGGDGVGVHPILSRRAVFSSNSVPSFVSAVCWFWVNDREPLAEVHPVSSLDRGLHDSHRGAILVDTNQGRLVSKFGDVLEGQFHHSLLASLSWCVKLRFQVHVGDVKELLLAFSL